MGQWTGELHLGELHGDGTRFSRPDPNGKHALAVTLFENDYGGIRRPIERKALNPYLYQHAAQTSAPETRIGALGPRLPHQYSEAPPGFS
jgi:hypothetical protein